MSDRCPWKDLPKYFDHAGAVERIRQEPSWSERTHTPVLCEICPTFFLATNHTGWHVVGLSELSLWQWEQEHREAA